MAKKLNKNKNIIFLLIILFVSIFGFVVYKSIWTGDIQYNNFSYEIDNQNNIKDKGSEIKSLIIVFDARNGTNQDVSVPIKNFVLNSNNKKYFPTSLSKNDKSVDNLTLQKGEKQTFKLIYIPYTEGKINSLVISAFGSTNEFTYNIK